MAFADSERSQRRTFAVSLQHCEDFLPLNCQQNVGLGRTWVILSMVGGEVTSRTASNQSAIVRGRMTEYEDPSCVLVIPIPACAPEDAAPFFPPSSPYPVGSVFE